MFVLQSFENVATQIGIKAVEKLVCCADYKKLQIEEMCSFRDKLDQLSDKAAAELHKVSSPLVTGSHQQHTKNMYNYVYDNN